MGYFKRPVDRERARVRKRAMNGGRVPVWVEAVMPSPADGPARPRFVRFAVNRWDARSGQPEGVFAAAYRLIDEADVGVEGVAELRRKLVWFSRNLKAPEGFGESRAVFWFREDGGEFSERVWDLVAFLKGHGLTVLMTTTSWPGAVVYEDGHQVAAIPSSAVKCGRGASSV